MLEEGGEEAPGTGRTPSWTLLDSWISLALNGFTAALPAIRIYRPRSRTSPRIREVQEGAALASRGKDATSADNPIATEPKPGALIDSLLLRKCTASMSKWAAGIRNNVKLAEPLSAPRSKRSG